jgi:hypothetical protein
MSAACSSTRPREAASAAPTAPEPQHRSTITDGGPVPAAGPAACRREAAARRTRNSVRRRGMKTPGSTAIRRPQNSAQPRTCSSGWPAAAGPPWRPGRPGPRRGDEQPRLVLGEDAARGPEPGDGGRRV